MAWFAHASVFASPASYDLRVAAGPLDDALISIARQAEVSVVFSPDSTEGMRSVALAGEYSLPDALDTVIGENCLTYDLVRPTLVSIKPGCAEKVPEPEPALGDLELDSEPPERPIEEILVREEYITGSRIRHPDYRSPSPIDGHRTPQQPATDL